MLEILLYSRIGKGLLPPSTEISELTFLVKKYSEAFRGVYSREKARKLKIKCLSRGRSRPRI